MSRLSALVLLGSIAPVVSSCGPTDVASPGEGNIVVIGGTTTTPPTTPPPGTPAASCPAGTIDRGVVGTKRSCELPARFTADTVLTNLPGVAYSISGPVNVGTDCGGDPAAPVAGCQAVTLTIQAGTLLFASNGSDYLVVNRGSRMNAIGTAASPIIFTAAANLLGTATDNSMGLWGGIILLGRAPISDCNTAVAGGSANCQQVIEGTTSSLYGGNAPNDNSGILQYIQIRYSGFAIAPGNELQSLTTGGVGQLTTIDHIQSHNSSDDGLEFFGGRQNLKYFVETGADDDGLDTDLGYRGTIQFVIAVQRDASNGDDIGPEADSNGNEDALPRQYTRVSNATFVGKSTVQGGNGMILRGGTDYALLNSILISPNNCLDIDETAGTTTRAANTPLQDLGPPVFRSVVMRCTNPYTNDGNVTVAQIQAIFGSGTNNNNDNYTPSLVSVFVNGANEAAVPATDPTPFNTDIYAGTGQPNAAAPNRLTAVTYIGAVKDAADTWYAGWTCNSSYANFGGSSGLCTAVPG